MDPTERKFRAAVDVIQNLPKDGPYQTSNEMKLNFYARYKQATQGPCTQTRPSFWDPIGRAKHDAWAALGDMERLTAMKSYVDLLSQIVETMNYSPDVEKFMDVVGPFYEFVDESTLKRFNITAGQNKTVNTSHSSIVEESTLEEEEEEEEQIDENQIDALLGKYLPPEGFQFTGIDPAMEFLSNGQVKSEPDQNHNHRDHVGFNFDVGDSDDQDLDEDHQLFIREIQAAKEELNSTHSLISDIKRMRNRQGDEEKALTAKDRRGTENQKNVCVGQEKWTEMSLSQREIDQMLDRYESFLPNTGEDGGAEARVEEGDGGGRCLERDEERYIYSSDSESEDNDSGDDIFEDSVDFTPGDSEEKRQIESLLESAEEEEILIVSSHRKSDLHNSTISSPSLDRFLVSAVDQLNQDLHSLETSVQQVTRTLSGIDNNLQQVSRRLSSIEYLLQIVVQKPRAYPGEKLLTYIAYPVLALALGLLAKNFLSHRKSLR